MDPIKWNANWTIKKSRFGETYNISRYKGNLLMYAGATAVLDWMTGGTVAAYLDNSNAHIGVGDSATAVSALHTDLQAATNKNRQPMDASYPIISGTAPPIATFQTTFAPGEASFTWNEVGLFTASTGGVMVNRRLISEGTKSALDEWVVILTLTLS